eukprot:GDKJ01018456.1.p1 GENE.GDKJ01018456.1~~GDKJ01018456.1.p1  ORF type:complete len:229 (-),score=47.69 GDKJ01018456.1:54-716(-)
MSRYIQCELPERFDHLTMMLDGMALSHLRNEISSETHLVDLLENSNPGDVVAFGNFRDSMTCILDSEMNLIQNMDDGGEGFLSIPSNISDFVENPIDFYRNLAICTIALNENHPLLKNMFSEEGYLCMMDLLRVDSTTPVGQVHIVYSHPAFKAALSQQDDEEWSSAQVLHSHPSIPKFVVVEFQYGRIKFEFESIQDTKVAEQLKEVRENVLKQLTDTE